jgi:hypothetical protein
LKNTNDIFEGNENILAKNSNTNNNKGKNIKLQKNLYPFVLNKNGKNNSEEVSF